MAENPEIEKVLELEDGWTRLGCFSKGNTAIIFFLTGRPTDEMFLLHLCHG
jgi:hypothetical protein